MRRGCVLAVGVALLASASASAEPYELIAIYTPISGTARDVRLPLETGAMLPDGAEGYRLARIVVHFKQEALAATTLTAFSRFEFRVRVGQEPPALPVTVDTRSLEANPDRDIPLPDWIGAGQRDARTSLRIEARSIYEADFLCLQERALLSREGVTVPATSLEAWRSWQPAPTQADAGAALQTPQPDGGLPSTASPCADATASLTPQPDGGPPSGVFQCAGGPAPEADAGSESPERKRLRTEGGTFILYTFCKGRDGEDLNDDQDWSKLASPKEVLPRELTVFRFEDLPATATGTDIRRRHKRALVEQLATRLNQFRTHFGKAAVDATAEEFDKALLYVQDDYELSILKAGGAVKLEEESSGQVRPLADQVDQKSQVILSLMHELCLDLPPEGLLKSPWSFELEVDDKGGPSATKRLEVPLGFRHECTRVLNVPWKDFLDQQVTFRIVFRNPGAEDLVVYRHSFHVYNFGLITIFPVASEILGAATEASPKDIESTSVIPISFALSVGGDRSNTYAVTFPFVLGVNTRSAPRLAEYIALAPSVSLIAGDASKAPHFAFGVGINLARAFHFGYAWAPDATSNYVLIGISIPELMPLLSGFGGSPAAPP